MIQTPIQKKQTIRFGSAKFEISTDGVDWTNFGAMDNVKMSESWTESELKAHNAGTILKRRKDHKVSVSGDLLEIDFDKLFLLRGGVDYKSVQPGTSQDYTYFFQPGETETGREYILPVQNYNKTPLDIKFIVKNPDATTPTPLTVNIDYHVIQTNDNETAIVFIPGVDYDSNTKMKVIYAATTRVKILYSTGGKTIIDSAIQARLTNTDENGKMLRVTVFKSYASKGIELNFKADDADEANSIPIEIGGVLDTDRELGQQLFLIEDEQGV